MGPKKTFEYQGRKVQGQSVEFTARSENWQQYELEDGSQLKVKIVLLDVVRLDEYGDNGDPVYQFTAQQLIGIQAPDALKKKAQ